MLHHSIDSPVHWNTAHSQECNTAGQQFIISLQKNAEHQQNTAHTISHCTTQYHTVLHKITLYCTRIQEYRSKVHCTSSVHQTRLQLNDKRDNDVLFLLIFLGGFTTFRGTTHIDTEKVKQSWMAKGTMMYYFCWFWWRVFTNFRGTTHIDTEKVKQSWMAEGTMMCYFCWFF